jgi:hypothetical protein
MASTDDVLFGPLSKDYCLWFYFLSIIGLVLMVLILVPGLMLGVSKKMGITYYLGLFAVALSYGVVYFQNRLLHSMCMNTT